MAVEPPRPRGSRGRAGPKRVTPVASADTGGQRCARMGDRRRRSARRLVDRGRPDADAEPFERAAVRYELRLVTSERPEAVRAAVAVGAEQAPIGTRDRCSIAASRRRDRGSPDDVSDPSGTAARRTRQASPAVVRGAGVCAGSAAGADVARLRRLGWPEEQGCCAVRVRSRRDRQAGTTAAGATRHGARPDPGGADRPGIGTVRGGSSVSGST